MTSTPPHSCKERFFEACDEARQLLRDFRLVEDRFRDIVQIGELLAPFLLARTDERAIQQRITSAINRLITLGFLKQMPDTSNPVYFEVRRILKAKIDAEKLAEIKEKLARYGTTAYATE